MTSQSGKSGQSGSGSRGSAKRATTTAKKTTTTAPKRKKKASGPTRTSESGSRPQQARSWYLLVYRAPSESPKARVAIWRELKRTGALYLQQAVCVLPASAETAQAVADIRERIAGLNGRCNYFEIAAMDDEQEQEIVSGFQARAAKEYEEIMEECDTKFVKEIEFERFRENYTFEEAEEIRQDLEKIRRWFDRVIARDWFGGTGRTEVEQRILECEQLLEEFEEDVFERTGGRDE